MLEWFLTGGALPPVLMACGAFFVIYLKGYPFRNPFWMWRSLWTPTGKDGISPFRALMQALAGTLGVGNIVGVASAIRIGGAGALFWMWISAILAMVLKYAEILLAVLHRRRHRSGGYYGGAFYYIKDHFLSSGHVRLGVILASVFALLMMLDAFSMGCVIQSGAIGSAFEGVLHISPWITGAVLVILTLPLLWRGTRGISALTEYLVPIMTVGYIILSVAVLVVRHEAVLPAFASVFTNAFSPESIGGGVIGFLTSRALRIGTMRGLLSNEAGCGTAPVAHAEADAVSPAAQGVWGIFEVFVDTVLLCSCSAMVILVGGDISLYGADDVMLTIRSYASVLGDGASYFFCTAVFCFGYATLLCWGGYGLESLRFLSSKKHWRVLYIILFGACILYGAQGDFRFVWKISDFAIAALTGINLVTLLLCRREIRRETFEASASQVGK